MVKIMGLEIGDIKDKDFAMEFYFGENVAG
jgi:hypothetical protein